MYNSYGISAVLHWISRENLGLFPEVMVDRELRNDRRWDMLASIVECLGIVILMIGMLGPMITFCAHYPVLAVLIHIVLIIGAWARLHSVARESKRLTQRIKELE